MRASVAATLLMISVMFGFRASGAEIRQDCEILNITHIPEKYRDAVHLLQPIAIRACRELSLDHITYAALGPITRSPPGVCSYISTMLSSKRLSDRTQYMASTDSKCPPLWSSRYVAVNSLSTWDFRQIMDTVSRILMAADKTEFQSIPEAQLESPSFDAFKTFLRTAKGITPLQITRYPMFLGICSNFNVLLSAGDGQSRRLYTVKLRKCIAGGMKIVDVEATYS